MSDAPYVVLVGMDFSELADRAFVEALDLPLAGKTSKCTWFRCLILLQSAEIRLQRGECSLQRAEIRLQCADCTLQRAEIRLQCADCRLQWAEIPLHCAECRLHCAECWGLGWPAPQKLTQAL